MEAHKEDRETAKRFRGVKLVSFEITCFLEEK